MRKRPRLGAYGPARDVEADAGSSLFPLRLTCPADVPELTLRAVEANDTGIGQAAGLDPEDWPIWSTVPVDRLDLDAFDDDGQRLRPCLGSAKVKLGPAPAGKGGRR